MVNSISQNQVHFYSHFHFHFSFSPSIFRLLSPYLASILVPSNIMKVEQPAEVALLDAVRTELTKLTLDCDSDSCPSLSPNHHEGSLPDSSFSASSVSTSIVMVETPITSPDNELEPFPEYQDVPDNSADERLWEELFTLAMKEDIRSEQIDPYLTLTFVSTEAQRNRLDDIKDLLSNPKLPRESRANLVAIAKRVIRLEYLLFRNSDKFLNPEDTAEAQKVASYILDWIAAVDNEVQESLNTTSPVVEVLETLQHEDMAAVHRFRQMASVVFSLSLRSLARLLY